MSRHQYRVISYRYAAARTAAEAKRLTQDAPPLRTLVQVRVGHRWVDVTHQVDAAEGGAR